MATLHSLKRALTPKSTEPPYQRSHLYDSRYSAGFNILVRDPGWTTYQDFIIPQLSQLLGPLINSRTHISVLEIGPGPKSVLGHLPGGLRRKISRYTAFEPNDLFSADLKEWLRSTVDTDSDSPLPCLERPPVIHRTTFRPDNNIKTDERYDVILFCHSMYGIKPKRKFIEHALEMLVDQPEDGMVVIFHRDGDLQLDALVAHRTASFQAGVVSVADDDEELDLFASLIAGFEVNEAARVEWRKVCRALGRREEARPDHLLFSAPNLMATFTRHATALPELAGKVRLFTGDMRIKEREDRLFRKDPYGGHTRTEVLPAFKLVKNREACLHHPAAIVKPKEVDHVRQCVLWALKHQVGLAVIGGGHSGHCLRPNVVSVDMGAFNRIHILTAGADGGDSGLESGALVVAGAGCKTGDIIAKTMAAGLTVPLGNRPSVGAGLWLQGGIGHLARLHGLACDAIVGAVLVSPDSGRILYVGRVPKQHRPAGAVCPENHAELLWAIKGAGTNFGIVVSVTFRASPARRYLARNWIVPLSDDDEARLKLSRFDELVANKVPRHCSAGAYLYWDAGQLHLGVSMFDSYATADLTAEMITPESVMVDALGVEVAADTVKFEDGVGVFEAEMYMSVMHGGHARGKTSSFKRCLFLKNIGSANIADKLIAAVKARPSPLCYLHLLQGGGAVSDVAADATAFGCRDWDFACVITGVWPRDKDDTDAGPAAVKWVYDVAMYLLPLSNGAYGADLGPDPRDAALAARAFGPNRPLLARLKRSLDPRNVLAFACPLPEKPMEPKLIIIVTGKHGAGKDYCAESWASDFAAKNLAARAVSISDATKREYAAATGTDVDRLLVDRAYKEKHRPALTKFFQEQLEKRPRLLEKHFLGVVHGAADVDVLLITGMRDEAPVATLSHLVPDSRLVEVRVQDTEGKWVDRLRRGDGLPEVSDLTGLKYRPDLVFDNKTRGDEAAKKFAEESLLPLVHADLQRLASMVRSVPDFPRPDIEFRHILNIAQKPGGLALCTSLLEAQVDWTKIGAIATCEAGGYVFASALSLRVGVPLALIRGPGKLPPPTVSIDKQASKISSSASRYSKFAMERGVVARGALVVVVDDVLASGNTLLAVLRLLDQAGVRAEDVRVIAVAEFPAHRGRENLHRLGFGKVSVQSLLIFGGL